MNARRSLAATRTTHDFAVALLWRSTVLDAANTSIFATLSWNRWRYCAQRFIPRFAAIANRWNEAMGLDIRYPGAHAKFLVRCHAAGQTKPTPLLLRYGPGDYNCLHQDIYGEHVFPLQVAILLSEPGRDFAGGEFVLTEQRPRMQSRVEVVTLRRGEG